MAGQVYLSSLPSKCLAPERKKIAMYIGARNNKLLEDWVADATRVIRGQADGDAVDFLVYHLEGTAKDEVRLRPAADWSTPVNFNI